MTRCLACLCLALVAIAADAATRQPDPARIEELTRMLPQSPRGVGRPITDRQAWDAVAKAPRFKNVVKQAERLATKPLPELTDAFFTECARIGDRKRCNPVIRARHGRFGRLTIAECIENKGRFLPAIESAIRAVCAETTWLHPAHDRRLLNVQRRIVEIDLGSSAVSWQLATVRYSLGDKLSPAVRKLIRDELERRTFVPFERMIHEGKPRLWWLTTTSNWNAVCLAGVTGAALTTIESPQRRAFFLAAAEKYIQRFISGFTPAGFCSEGLGYWSYGFGNFVKLAETAHQATNGQMDLFAIEKVRQVAQFGRRMQILPGVCPAFADCSPRSRPPLGLSAFLSRRLAMGWRDVERRGLGLAACSVTSPVELGLFGFPNSATALPPADPATAPHVLRDWFPDAGCLVCRPAPDHKAALGVAIKGGHNAEHHNHNDVGTFVVARGGKPTLLDPGNENYTGRTFGARRYESKVLNSFGHPVPVVAGQLQSKGPAAAARTLAIEFTEAADTLVLDLRAAYPVKSLKKLVRTFVYSRKGRTGLTVTDDVAFDTPKTFGTALITFSKWRQATPTRLIVGEGPAAVQVDIDAGGNPIEFKAEEIHEDLPGHRIPTRLGIHFAQPITQATLTLTIAPAP